MHPDTARAAVVADGVELELNYVDTGAREGAPALVLVHGLGGSLQHWQAVIPRLAERAHVVALDLPGFGGSPLPRRRHAFDLHVDAVAALIRELGLHDVVLAGHSLGGPLALRFAARFPGVASRLVLVCGTVQSFQATLAGRAEPWLRAPRTAFATVAEVAMSCVRPPRRVRELLAATRVGRRAALWPFVKAPADLPAHAARILIDGAGSKGVLPSARALGALGAWDRQPPRPVEIDAINGTHDLIAPLRDLRRLQVPLRRSVVLEGGHVLMLEAPERFADALLGLLDDAGARIARGE